MIKRRKIGTITPARLMIVVFLLVFVGYQTVAYAQQNSSTYCEDRYGVDDLNACYRILWSQGILFVDPIGNSGSGNVEGSSQCIGKALPTINDSAGFAAAINQYIDEWLGPNRTSPFQGLGQDFVDGGIKTGLNPMLLVAHLKIEASFATGPPTEGWAGNTYSTEQGALNQDQSQRVPSYNAFGREGSSKQPIVYYKNNEGRIRTPYKWASWADSISGPDSQFELIKRRYGDLPPEDLTAHIMRYAPPTDGNDVEKYVQGIKDTMTAIIALAGDSLSCGGASGSYIWPIAKEDYQRMATCWNTPRVLNGKSYRHGGLDISAALGSPILATAPGEVVFRGLQGGNGNLTVIRHDDGLYSFYKHQQRFDESATVGARVTAGQTIGYVDSTGLSTGDHLHFDIGVTASVSNANPGASRTKNPLDYLPDDDRGENVTIPGDSGASAGSGGVIGYPTGSSPGTCVPSSVNSDGYIGLQGVQNINVR